MESNIKVPFNVKRATKIKKNQTEREIIFHGKKESGLGKSNGKKAFLNITKLHYCWGGGPKSTLSVKKNARPTIFAIVQLRNILLLNNFSQIEKVSFNLWLLFTPTLVWYWLVCGCVCECLNQ